MTETAGNLPPPEADKRTDFTTVQFDLPNPIRERNFAQFAAEYTLNGSRMSWSENPYAVPEYFNRRVLIDTASGNTYFVTGNKIIDMRSTRAAKSIVAGSADELLPVVVGKRWLVEFPVSGKNEIQTKQTSKVVKILVATKIVEKKLLDTDQNQRGLDPFLAIDRELAAYKAVDAKESPAQTHSKSVRSGRFLGKLIRKS